MLHIGTVLTEEGYSVTIIDAVQQPNYKELILKDINNTLIIGVTCLTSEVASAIEISDYVKSISDVPVIWGGWHPTLFPEQICADGSVDFVCVGEGEHTILELVRALESGASHKDISGLAYKADGRVKVNPRKGYVNLEELPPINYDLIDMSQYIRTEGISINWIRYQSSRGCPHRCSFCINPVTGNQQYRAKSPEKVGREIELLVAKYDVNYVSFVDDNFFVNIRRSRAIAEEIIKRKLHFKWFAECRADYFRPGFVDEEFLDLAQRSGLSEFTIGAESGSQRVLDDLLTKDITIPQLLNSAKVLSRFDIVPDFSFIVGIPGETKEEIVATIRLAQEIYRLCPSQCGFVTFTPYPGCQLTQDLVKKGFLEQPRTLRAWSNNAVRELYYGRFSGKPWHDDTNFINNIIYYTKLAYVTYLYADTKKWLVKTFRHPLRYRAMPFVLIAQIRMKHLNFALPIEKLIFNALLKILKITRQIFKR